jgi:hypothetical protein
MKRIRYNLLLVFALFLNYSGKAQEEIIGNEQKEVLQRYFSNEVILDIENYLKEFNSLKSDREFEQNYRKGCNLLDSLYSKFYKAETDFMKEITEADEYWNPIGCCLDDLQTLSGELGPIDISCVAECTEIDFYFKKDILLEKAEQTKGTADDEILELAIYIDGYYGRIADWGFKVWFEQTWDYGGSSLLGDTSVTDAIFGIMQYKRKHDKMFEQELKMFKKHIVNELSSTISYMFTKEKVLKEFNSVIKLKYFDSEEIEQIKKHLKELNDPKKEIQFDCRNSPCSYG